MSTEKGLESLHHTRNIHRVVVTGMGAITPLGLSVSETWDNVITGKSGIKVLESPPDPRVTIAGQITDFDPEVYFPKKELRRIHRSSQCAFAALVEALKDAKFLIGNGKEGWKLTNINPERIGLCIGSGEGGSTYAGDMERTIIERGSDRIPPSAIFQILIERVNTVSSMILGTKGPLAAIVAACATGSESLSYGARIVMLGEADGMGTGGSEAALDRIGIGSFAALRGALSKNNILNEASRPFDKDADGFVMSEGAGVLILESLEHALGRGANIHAELVGFGETSDAHHETEPSQEGAVRAIRIALDSASIKPSEVDYLNAHGTSTPVGGPVELNAIREVFGEDVSKVSISSTKSAMGHLLGAAGGVEAIMAIMAIKEGIVPPTLNLYNPVPEAEGMDLVPLIAKRREVNVAMSNSFGFGGINSVLVFRKYQMNYPKAA